MLGLGYQVEDCHRKRALTDYKALADYPGGLGQLREFVTIINNKKRQQIEQKFGKPLSGEIEPRLKVISFNDPNDLLRPQLSCPACRSNGTIVISGTRSAGVAADEQRLSH